ncbi:MAG: glycosyltransferase family 2 protein [Melioribacteraceae bacterium]|nr:glycosyltransferase family 2 protein [Melioribacteraceae bacterium]
MNGNLITVIMPLKSGMPYLKDSVNSILAQSISGFELIIVDDHSTDNSIEYLNGLPDSRIRIINNIGEGIADAMNTGINLVKTKYVAVMDSDDICNPDRLQKQVNILENEKDIVLVGTSIKYIGTKDMERSWGVKMPDGDVEIKNGINKGMYVISHPTIMIRTKAVKEIGGYRRELFPNIDLDLFSRLITKGRFANITDYFTYIRLRSESFTQQNLFEIVRNSYMMSKQNRFTNSFYDQLAVRIKYLSTKNYKSGLLKYLDHGSILWPFNLLISSLLDLPKSYFYIRNKIVG